MKTPTVTLRIDDDTAIEFTAELPARITTVTVRHGKGKGDPTKAVYSAVLDKSQLADVRDCLLQHIANMNVQPTVDNPTAPA